MTGTPDAVDLLERHAGDSLATSTLVRGYTWTFLNRRHDHRAATAFLDRVERSPREAGSRSLL